MLVSPPTARSRALFAELVPVLPVSYSASPLETQTGVRVMSTEWDFKLMI